MGEDINSSKSEDLGGSKFKFLCSYGGKILPRPGDGQLRYTGGETRVVAFNKNINFEEIMNKLGDLFDSSVILKYQLPMEDLDTLVSVTCDEDLQNMKEEYDRFESCCCKESCTRFRFFLFPAKQAVTDATAESQTLEQRYIDAVNGIGVPKLHQAVGGFNCSESNGQTEIEMEGDCPTTASASPESRPFQDRHHNFQNYHHNHRRPPPLKLREVDTKKQEKRHINGLQKNASHYVPREPSQLRKVASEGMMVFPLSLPPPSPPIVDDSSRRQAQFHRVRSLPSNMEMPADHFHCRHAILHRATEGGGGGEGSRGSRLKYSKSEVRFNRPPHQFVYNDHACYQDKVMNVAHGSVLVSRELPKNVASPRQMIRNAGFEHPHSRPRIVY
uniref:PB1 domain-containing protein n=1 Tax=Araucaria cunninghamii TaxID=56994 RepID=A0A0D6QXD2_ARACU